MCRIYTYAVIICWTVHFVVSANECLGPNIESKSKYYNQLEPLKGIRNLQAKYDKYLYRVGICTNAVDEKEFDEPYAAVIQCEGDNCHNNYTVIGRYNSTALSGGTDWIMLKYDDGERYHSHCNQDERSVTIMIICDPDASTPVLTALEENNKLNEDCYYLFELSSVVACTNPKHGLSGGAVFLLVFFTVLGAYLLIGFLYQRVIVGAQGMEQIPNYSFWKNFGKLQADGCDFFCRCGERQENKMYRNIDDNLPETVEELDRDDHLLPM